MSQLNDKRRVATIRIENVGGIDFLEFHPSGGVTFIEGPNGVGKTSVFDAIRSVVDGGHDARLLRNGEESGRITLILDNKEEIVKVITQRDSSLTIRDAERRLKKAPKTYLNSLLDSFAVDPVSFLRATPKDRVQMLLQTLPIELTDDHRKLLKEAGAKPEDFELKHPLVILGDVRKSLYDERTFVNRHAKESKASADKLREQLPADWGASNIEEDLKGLELRQTGLRQQREKELGTADSLRTQKVTAAESRFAAFKHTKESEYKDAKNEKDIALNAAVSDLDLELERKIAELREAHQKAVGALRESHQSAVTELRNAAQIEVDREREALNAVVSDENEAHADSVRSIESEYGPALEQVAASIAALSTKVEMEKTMRAYAAQIDAFDREAHDRELTSSILTGRIEQIDSIKRELLRDLPAGLEIRDGDIYRDDVAFDRLNKAQQIQLSIDIAKLRGRMLPLMAVDESESLDAESQEMLATIAEENELQLLLFRVVNGDRQIHVVSQEEEVAA